MTLGIGLGQLKKIDKLQEYRKKIWDIYQDEFGAIDGVEIPLNAEEGDRHSYFTYFIRIKKRDEIAKYLFDNGIYTTLRYHPLHMNPLYKSDAHLPNCELMNETGLNIPIHPSLTMDDVDRIVEYMKKAVKGL